MRSHTKRFEVEHPSRGTDGSLISKLEMGMINALGQLHPTRALQNKLASVYIDVYERVWSGVVFVVVHVSSGINARGCLSLYADDICLFFFCPLRMYR